jgi:uncharacterized membrane protein YphA (DoxX/SURF4 family)
LVGVPAAALRPRQRKFTDVSHHAQWRRDRRQLAPYAALLPRIGLGAMWIVHAMLKLFVFTPPGTAKFFDSVGLPGMLAYPVIAAEVIGGIAILTGFFGGQASPAGR